MTGSPTRKLLVIAYEFPPSAGAGVQRIAKLARYLPESGWQPYVLSATPVWGRPTDEALVAQVADVEVRRLPNRNVAATLARMLQPLKRAGGRPSDGVSPPPRAATGSPVTTRIARRFYLDSAELWSRRVPHAAERWHHEVGFDAVLASGPPHSALLAGARLARRLGVPFLADLRDPWRDNPGYRWPDSPVRDSRSLELEREVMRATAAVLAASRPIADEAIAMGSPRAEVVPNGFDPSELPSWTPADGPLRLCFIGRFYTTTDPASFLDGLALAIERSGGELAVQVEVAGPDSSSVRGAVTSRGLDHVVRFLGYLPHADALRVAARSDAGLVVLRDVPGAEAIYSSKLFEYLGIGLPVLLVGPSRGVAAELVEEARAGIVVSYGDVDAIASAVARMAAEKTSGLRAHEPLAEVVSRFDRRRQSATIASVLDETARPDARAPQAVASTVEPTPTAAPPAGDTSG